jgi:hypothetical protein
VNAVISFAEGALLFIAIVVMSFAWYLGPMALVIYNPWQHLIAKRWRGWTALGVYLGSYGVLWLFTFYVLPDAVSSHIMLPSYDE